MPVSTIQDLSLRSRCLPPAFHLLYVLPYSCSTSRNDGVRLCVSLVDVSTSGKVERGEGARFVVG